MPAPILPTLEIRQVQKNSTGEQYQIGDRIGLYVELSPDQITQARDFKFEVSKDDKKLVDQGWFLDPKSEVSGNMLRFIVSPIQKGTLTLPSLNVVKDENTAIARTTSWTIQVLGPEKGKEETALIDVISVDLALKYWIIFSLIGLVLFITAFYFIRKYLLSRKNKRITTPSVPVIIESDHALALRLIEILYKNYPFSRENLKPICFGLSEILKNFFSKRFQIDATESTTDEMLALLKRVQLSQEDCREVEQLFRDLDLIKFIKESDYPDFKEFHYQDFKIKSQAIVQKWAVANAGVQSP